jgi:forkhead box protein N
VILIVVVILFYSDHFPYFKTAPSGWKNSVRHNLSLNKCFEKIEKPGNGARKGCLWALNPAKVHKMDEEVQKWSRKDPLSIRKAMSDPGIIHDNSYVINHAVNYRESN